MLGSNINGEDCVPLVRAGGEYLPIAALPLEPALAGAVAAMGLELMHVQLPPELEPGLIYVEVQKGASASEVFLHMSASVQLPMDPHSPQHKLDLSMQSERLQQDEGNVWLGSPAHALGQIPGGCLVCECFILINQSSWIGSRCTSVQVLQEATDLCTKAKASVQAGRTLSLY